MGQAAGFVLQPHQLQHIGDALFDLLFRRADDAHGKGHVVVDRLIVDQAEILEDDAQGPAHIGHGAAADLLQGEAVDEDAAEVGISSAVGF